MHNTHKGRGGWESWMNGVQDRKERKISICFTEITTEAWQLRHTKETTNKTLCKDDICDRKVYLTDDKRNQSTE